MYSAKLICIIYLVHAGFHCKRQCIENLPSFEEPSADWYKLPKNAQAIIPAYKFTCSGNITEWHAIVDDIKPMRIDFQVWRMEQSGKYKLIGANAYLHATPVMNKLKLSVPVNLQIQVNPGDIMGVRTEGNMTIHYINNPNMDTYVMEGTDRTFSMFGPDITHTVLNGAPLINAEFKNGKFDTYSHCINLTPGNN